MNKIEEDIKILITNIKSWKNFNTKSKEILEACFSELLINDSNINEIKQKAENKEENQNINKFFNGFLLLIVEFQRKCFMSLEIQLNLKEIGFLDEFITFFIEKYEEFIKETFEEEELKEKFNSLINLNQIVDVSWELVDNINSKYCNFDKDKENFIITLQLLNDNNKIVPFSFNCNKEGLTELVFSLKSAINSVNQINLKDLKI